VDLTVTRLRVVELTVSDALRLPESGVELKIEEAST
jgi:hypothetical protein